MREKLEYRDELVVRLESRDGGRVLFTRGFFRVLTGSTALAKSPISKLRDSIATLDEISGGR